MTFRKKENLRYSNAFGILILKILSPLDSAYFDEDSYQTLIATAWIAFVDATPENGCMKVIS